MDNGVVKISTTWLEQAQPQIGQWKKLPRPHFYLAKEQFVKFDGEHWVITPYRPSGAEWVGTIEGFVSKKYINDPEKGFSKDNYELTEYTGLTYDYRNTITGYEGYVAPEPLF